MYSRRRHRPSASLCCMRYRRDGLFRALCLGPEGMHISTGARVEIVGWQSSLRVARALAHMVAQKQRGFSLGGRTRGIWQLPGRSTDGASAVAEPTLDRSASCRSGGPQNADVVRDPDLPSAVTTSDTSRSPRRQPACLSVREKCGRREIRNDRQQASRRHRVRATVHCSSRVENRRRPNVQTSRRADHAESVLAVQTGGILFGVGGTTQASGRCAG